MKLELLDRVRQLAADAFNERLSNITAQSSPDTIAAWDSLTHLNFVFALEESFSCEIQPEEIERASHSIADTVEMLEKKLARA